MIGWLSGKIIDIFEDGIVLLQVGQVGYNLQVLATDLLLGDDRSFYIHTQVREDDLSLYGFLQKEELAFFRLLLSVNGIGAKIGLQIMRQLPLSTLAMAILQGDEKQLTQIKGLGKKGASRLVVELKDKLKKKIDFFVSDRSLDEKTLAFANTLNTPSSKMMFSENDDQSYFLEALLALGFTNKNASAHLQNYDASLSLEDNIKLVLKQRAKDFK